jgi:hypothetical protein
MGRRILLEWVDRFSGGPMMATTTGKVAVLAAIAALPLMAQAENTYRCTGKDGKRYYGSTVPQPCYGARVEVLNSQGMVVQRIDPDGDEKARAAKAAEEERQKKRETASREASRRDRALLATYGSEKDIEEQRGRALADNQRAVKELEGRIQDIRKRQAAFDREMAQYLAPKNPPPQLVEDLKATEVDLSAQQNLLALKRKESEQINARYNEDRKRFAQLTRKR